MFLTIKTEQKTLEHNLNDSKHFLRLMSLSLVVTFFLVAPVDTSHAKSPKVPLVVVEKAQTKSVIKQVPLTGTVTSPKIGRVSSEVSGQVSSMRVVIGDRVKKGETLLQLDREIEELTLKAYEASTLQSREELAEARRRHDSGKRLRNKSGISQEELDQRAAQVKITEAALNRQLAEQEKQQAIVKRHTIRAPFNGVISEKLTEVGEWIETGKPLLTLIAMDDLLIDFQVPQELYSQIDDQSKMTVTLVALRNKSLAANIIAVVPVSDPSARTFLVRTRLATKGVNMTPGMSAQGKLQVSTGKEGVIVSRDAILRYPDGRVTVWVVKSDGDKHQGTERRVKVGHGFDGKVTITSGLESGAVVVVEGNEALKEGQTIRIQRSR